MRRSDQLPLVDVSPAANLDDPSQPGFVIFWIRKYRKANIFHLKSVQVIRQPRNLLPSLVLHLFSGLTSLFIDVFRLTKYSKKGARHTYSDWSFFYYFLTQIGCSWVSQATNRFFNVAWKAKTFEVHWNILLSHHSPSISFTEWRCCAAMRLTVDSSDLSLPHNTWTGRAPLSLAEISDFRTLAV